MKSITVWYMLVTIEETDFNIDDEFPDVSTTSYIEGMWDDYENALNYMKAYIKACREEPDYKEITSERYNVGGGFIDYEIGKTFYHKKCKIRKREVTLTKNE